MSSLYPKPRPKGKSVRQLVFLALTLHEELREVETGEERLIKYVQTAQENEGDPKSKGSSISRCARLLRRKHPELRGKDWEVNQKHIQKQVKDAIMNDTFGRVNPSANLEDFVL